MLKTGKNQIEIPTNGKTYVFIEVDKNTHPEIVGEGSPMHEGCGEEFITTNIDKWAGAIDFVI